MLARGAAILLVLGELRFQSWLVDWLFEDFPQWLAADAGTVHQFRHELFLPRLFWSITRWTSCLSDVTVRTLLTDGTINMQIFRFWDTVAVMKVVIFWDVAPCSPYVIRRFGRTYHILIQGGVWCEYDTVLRRGYPCWTHIREMIAVQSVCCKEATVKFL
jgi:hypothetical protein